MKEELMDSIAVWIASVSTIDAGSAKNKLAELMNGYTVEKQSTDLVVYSQAKTEWFITRFLTGKAVKGCSERTLKFYTQTINNFFRRCQKTPDEVTTDDIRLYIAIRLNKDHVSKTTVNNEIRNLSSFYTYLQKEEMIVKNPMARIDQVKTDKKKKKAFTEMDVEKIRAACRNAKEQMIIELLLSTGMRCGELVGIKKEDIKEESVVVRGKGNKYRTVYLNARAQMSLILYLRELADTKNPYLLPKIKSISIAHVLSTNNDDRIMFAFEKWLKEENGNDK